MKKIAVENFSSLVTSLDSREIVRGAASNVLNWMISKDKLELARGIFLIGAARAGKVNSLYFTKTALGDDVGWAKIGRKLFYYTDTLADWTEVGSDFFPAAAENDEVAFAEYITNQGNQVWMSSVNSSLYKIMSANPADPVDQYNAVRNFKGRIDIILNRMFLWATAKDKTAPYGSFIDNLINTVVTAEAIAGSTITRSGTLGFKAGAGALRTCFAVTFTDGTETFVDDYAGNLIGSAGGTGTINYATGAYSVTFKVNPTNPVTATYQWEDSTNKGIADFTKSATRQAGEGFVFRQDDAGELMTIKTYNDIQYCLHANKTYKLNIGSTDTDATNRIYRESVGIPNWRAACATGDGIYYIDTGLKNKPRFRLLTLDYKAQQDLPVTISLSLNLGDYIFDKGIVEEFYDYVLFVGRRSSFPENNVTFVYNKIWKTWTILDYAVNCMAFKNGLCLAGDNLTGNIFNLFSGFDYNGEIIQNEVEMSFDAVAGGDLCKVKRLLLKGFIQRDQNYKVYLNLDNAGYVEKGEIRGDGSYVDRGTSVSVGNTTIGNAAIGTKVVGDSKIESVNAYYYEHELKINTDKFEVGKLKFVAQGIGYVSINAYSWNDIRIKSSRTPKKYGKAT